MTFRDFESFSCFKPRLNVAPLNSKTDSFKVLWRHTLPFYPKTKWQEVNIKSTMTFLKKKKKIFYVNKLARTLYLSKLMGIYKDNQNVVLFNNGPQTNFCLYRINMQQTFRLFEYWVKIKCLET